MATPFTTLPLSPALQKGLAQIGYTEMTAIQEAALPAMLAGEDVAGQAETGSGKTAAFGLAVLSTIDVRLQETQALVLCPTRELADQVAAEIRRLAQRQANTRVVAVCGGHPFHPQRKALQRGSHVIVGTPGRVAKHLRAGHADLSRLRVLVLDEADRMLDMGFFEQVIAIEERCQAQRQTLLFSATFSDDIVELGETIQRSPKRITTTTQVAPELLRQQVLGIGAGERSQRVADLLQHHRPERALVFSETRVECDRLARRLTRMGAEALALHGQLEQRDRDDVLVQFGNGSANVLVATNVAARGLDISALPVVIIAELSRDPEVHLHRIGRTGRAGVGGLALTLVEPAEVPRLQAIEGFLGHPLPVGTLPPHADALTLPRPPNRTLLLLAGRRDKLRKADVLGTLVKDAGIPAKAIGRIDLMDGSCAVAITHAHARDALEFARRGRFKRKKVRARLL